MMRPRMAVQARPHGPEPAPVESDLVPHDLRFSALLGARAWWSLPSPVRERFSKRLDAGASVTYAGEIVESHRTWFGKLLAQLCRLIGAPLPLHNDVAVPAVVTVIEDGATGGQFWTR